MTTRADELRTWTLNDVVLIDGTGAPPVPETCVVIEDGVVVEVKPAAATAGGRVVVPGRGRRVAELAIGATASSVAGLTQALEIMLRPETRSRATAVAGLVRVDGASRAAGTLASGPVAGNNAGMKGGTDRARAGRASESTNSVVGQR